MIRFNRSYEFNVPYGHKPKRFSKAYITKIVNQVEYLERMFRQTQWQFLCQSFEKTIAMADAYSFIYCDPPYLGRHVDYYDSWDESQELNLLNCLNAAQAKYMVSTWDYNRYRKNPYIEKIWHMCNKINKEHFYFVGAKENNRNKIMEALLTNYTADKKANLMVTKSEQLQLAF
jgi:DNA adenine methylase